MVPARKENVQLSLLLALLRCLLMCHSSFTPLLLLR
jgi:hypothetical protein